MFNLHYVSLYLNTSTFFFMYKLFTSFSILTLLNLLVAVPYYGTSFPHVESGSKGGMTIFLDLSMFCMRVVVNLCIVHATTLL